MKRILVIISVLLVLLGLLLIMSFVLFPVLKKEGYAITGYDGPVATFNDVESPDIPQFAIDDGTWSKTVATTYAALYPVAPDYYDAFNPCGLRAEVQSVPNVLSQELLETVSKSVVDEEAETNTTTTVEIYKAKCTMGITISTWEGGLAAITDVNFWVELNDNADSIFSSAEDRFAYFIEVYTTNLPTQEGGMTVIPTAQGYSFDLDDLESEPVPQWLIDSGYTSSGSKFTSVRFPITVLTAVPITTATLAFPFIARAESYTTFYLGFDVILTGKWVHVSDYKEWDWPKLPDFWGDLLDAIAQFFWYIAGIVLSIVIVLKVKNPIYIALLLGLVWLLVLWQTGALVGLTGWLGL